MRLVFGVGINDAEYPTQTFIEMGKVNGKRKVKRIWICPFYQAWKDMLSRCYYKPRHRDFPTYKDCTVCDVWLRFSNFKAWMETQNWQDMHLDKDLLIKGNKVYSPSTCLFITPLMNTFMLECNSSQGPWPIGVTKIKNYEKFAAKCSDPLIKKRVHLGVFNTPKEAHTAWLSYKLKLAHLIANMTADARIADALIGRYENYKEEA